MGGGGVSVRQAEVGMPGCQRLLPAQYVDPVSVLSMADRADLLGGGGGVGAVGQNWSDPHSAPPPPPPQCGLTPD